LDGAYLSWRECWVWQWDRHCHFSQGQPQWLPDFCYRFCCLAVAQLGLFNAPHILAGREVVVRLYVHTNPRLIQNLVRVPIVIKPFLVAVRVIAQAWNN